MQGYVPVNGHLVKETITGTWDVRGEDGAHAVWFYPIAGVWACSCGGGRNGYECEHIRAAKAYERLKGGQSWLAAALSRVTLPV